MVESLPVGCTCQLREYTSSDTYNDSRTEASSIHSVERCWQCIPVLRHISPVHAERFCKHISRCHITYHNSMQLDSTKQQTTTRGKL